MVPSQKKNVRSSANILKLPISYWSKSPFGKRRWIFRFAITKKWDGSGYPCGLKEREIPLSARIFAVADVWDALSSDRPYRKGWAKSQVAEYLINESGKHFDPHVVNKFLSLVEKGEI